MSGLTRSFGVARWLAAALVVAVPATAQPDPVSVTKAQPCDQAQLDRAWNDWENREVLQSVVDVCHAAVSADPENQLLRYRLAVAKVWAFQATEIGPELEALAQADDPALLLATARMLDGAGMLGRIEVDEARVDRFLELAAAKGSSRAMLDLSQSARAKGDHERADHWFDRAVVASDMNPDPEVDLQLANRWLLPLFYPGGNLTEEDWQSGAALLRRAYTNMGDDYEQNQNLRAALLEILGARRWMHAARAFQALAGGDAAGASLLFRENFTGDVALVMPGDPEGEFSARIDAARMLRDFGLGDEAIPLYRELLDREFIFEALGESARARVIDNIGYSYFELGSYDEAEPFFLEAQQLREKNDLVLERATSLSNLADVLDAKGEYDAAAKLHFDSLLFQRQADQGSGYVGAAWSLKKYARNMIARDRAEEALPLLLEAIDGFQSNAILFGGVGGADQVIETSSILAGALHGLGKYKEALPLAQAVYDEYLQAQGAGHPLTWAAARQFATIRLATGLADPQTIEIAQVGASGIRTRRDFLKDSASATFQRERSEIHQADYSRTLADAIWAGGLAHGKTEVEEAFELIQEAMFTTTSQALTRMAARRVNDAALADVIKQREELEQRWQRLEFLLTQSAVKGEITDGVDLVAEKAEVERRIMAIDKQIEADFPEYFSFIRSRALDLAQASALMREDEAALLLVPSEFGTHVMVVTSDPSQIAWHRAELTEKQVSAIVAGLRKSLDQQIGRYDETYFIPFDAAASHRLYAALIEPVRERMAGKTHLYVAATGALGSLPPSVLVVDPPNGAENELDAMKETRWLIDDFAIVQIPSLQSLQLLRRISASSGDTKDEQGRVFDGFGDPVLGQRAGAAEAPEAQKHTTQADDAPRSGGIRLSSIFSRSSVGSDGQAIASVERLRNLAPLPGSAIELTNMALALKAPSTAVRIGPKATETAVKLADLRSSEIIAFATHGLVAGEIAGIFEPGLVLTPPSEASEDDDGYLSASEVATLNLNAEWVILSACNTAAGDGNGAPGLSGLARSFFFAGARNLLASHWPVRDDVATRITVATVQGQLASDMSRAEAFRQATIAIREDDADPSFAHPAAWAPFVLIGDR